MPRSRRQTRPEPYTTNRANRIEDLRKHLLDQANLPSTADSGDNLVNLLDNHEPRDNIPSQSCLSAVPTDNSTFDLDMFQAMVTMAVKQATAPLLEKI